MQQVNHLPLATVLQCHHFLNSLLQEYQIWSTQCDDMWVYRFYCIVALDLKTNTINSRDVYLHN